MPIGTVPILPIGTPKVPIGTYSAYRHRAYTHLIILSLGWHFQSEEEALTRLIQTGASASSDLNLTHRGRNWSVLGVSSKRLVVAR